MNVCGGCKEGRSTGFEPATFGSTIQRSNQLSYDRHVENNILALMRPFRQQQIRLNKHKILFCFGFFFQATSEKDSQKHQ